MRKIDSTTRLAKDLVDVLTVDRIDKDMYKSRRISDELTIGTGRLFGGLLVAQAFAAAQATVPTERPPVSLHCRFLRPGDEGKPVRYCVSRDMDGGSFSHRRIVADQGGQPILTFSAAFQRLEEGFNHQALMPEVESSPEHLWEAMEARLRSGEDMPVGIANYVIGTLPIQVAPVEPAILDDPVPRDDAFMVWIRFPLPLGEDPLRHRIIMTYLTDLVPLRPVDRRHGRCPFKGEIIEASLDHSIWFHEEVRADEWMLFVAESSWAGRGRGLGRAHVFARSGQMVASISQEGIARPPAKQS